MNVRRPVALRPSCASAGAALRAQSPAAQHAVVLPSWDALDAERVRAHANVGARRGGRPVRAGSDCRVPPEGHDAVQGARAPPAPPRLRPTSPHARRRRRCRSLLTRSRGPRWAPPSSCCHSRTRRRWRPSCGARPRGHAIAPSPRQRRRRGRGQISRPKPRSPTRACPPLHARRRRTGTLDDARLAEIRRTQKEQLRVMQARACRVAPPLARDPFPPSPHMSARRTSRHAGHG